MQWFKVLLHLIFFFITSLKAQVSIHAVASCGINHPKVYHFKGGPPATEIYDPGFSYRYGLMAQMKVNKYFSIDAHYHYVIFAHVNSERDPLFYGYCRQYAQSFGAMAFYNIEKTDFRVGIGIDYAIIMLAKAGCFGGDEFDNPDFWFRTLQLRYSGLNKYRIEPYVSLTKGLTPYNRFWLPFFAPDGIREVYVRDIEIGVSLRLLGKAKKEKPRKQKK